ncbi:hypothetical protein ADUPG1_011669, partial [Aduncisulcus paluster]
VPLVGAEETRPSSLVPDAQSPPSAVSLSPSLYLARIVCACHIVYCGALYTSLGMESLALCCHIAALRFTDILPAERCFYLAGMGVLKLEKAKKRSGGDSLGHPVLESLTESRSAFVLLNRFVEINIAITEGEVDIDGSDFETSDIPRVLNLKASPAFTSEDEREEAHEWVLTTNLDDSDDLESPQLPEIACNECGDATYEFGVQCGECSQLKQLDAVTMLPLASTGMSCTECKCLCGVEEWNAAVGKTRKCPWCGCNAYPRSEYP